MEKVKFKFKLSLAMKLLITLVMIISLIGLGLNVKQVFDIFKIGVYKIQTAKVVFSFLTLCLTLILTAFILSLLFRCDYTVCGELLVFRFGFIVVKHKIMDIVGLNLFKKTNKLVAFFMDKSYTVIVIDPKFYDGFIKALKQVNKAVLIDQVEDE